MINLKRFFLSSEERLESAKERIRCAQDRPAGDYYRILNLGGLGLNTDELKKLMPLIKKIPHLKCLQLHYNNLTTLPEEITELLEINLLDLRSNKLTSLPKNFDRLSELTYLYLNNNRLASIPKEILHFPKLINLNLNSNGLKTLPNELWQLLPKLETLHLEKNLLEELPEVTGDTSVLKNLIVNYNKLKKLPERISDLAKLENLHIYDNKLANLPDSLFEMNESLNIDVRKNRRLNSDMVWKLQKKFFVVLANKKRPHSEALLYKILGDEDLLDRFKKNNLKALQKRCKNIDVHKVLQEFLKKIPLNHPYSKTVFIPAAQSIIWKVIDGKSQQEQENSLIQIQTALGNCATPVKNFLTQTYIGLCKDWTEQMPDQVIEVLTSMAFEKKIAKEFEISRRIEGIEVMYALINSLFLSNSEDIPENKVPIIGREISMSSMSENIIFGFRQINEETALKFAKMCCKTDPETNELLKQGDKYIYDPEKVRAITEPYFASLGFVSKRERAVQTFEKAYKDLLQEENVAELSVSHYMEDDVIKLLDPNQILVFRAQLQKIPEDKIQAKLEDTIIEIKDLSKQLVQKYVPAASNASQLGLEQLSALSSCSSLSSIPEEKVPESSDTGIGPQRAASKNQSEWDQRRPSSWAQPRPTFRL